MATPTREAEQLLFNQSTRASGSEVASHLLKNLGPAMTAALVGKDAKTVRRYASGEGNIPLAAETSLRHAHRIFTYLELVDAAPTVRAWFMGMNPQLGDRAPIECLIEGRHHDVLAAAKAFVVGG